VLNNFAFSFSGNGILLFFLLLIAIVFSIFIYRRTNPIVPTFLRLLLTTIRAATLLLLIFIVFETILNFRFEKNNPPILAIAVDNSASMSITDSDGARPEIIKNVLSDDFTNRLADKFDLKYYTFSSDIKSFSPQRGDTLNFLGDATNISSSLEKIKADNVVENLTNILLISDGNYNDGGNPVRYAEELNVPIYTIGIGSDEPMMDIAIIDVNANPFTYAKQSTPIQITVRNTGYNRINVPIELEQDGQNIERQTIELAAAPSEKTVTLNYTPSTVGRQKLDLSIPAQSGEHLTENNKRSFYIDVFKSKLNILLIAGAVSPDISFIKRILQNDRYDVQSLIHKKNGQFYEEPPTV